MKNEIAKALLKMEMKDCKSKKFKEFIDSSLILGIPVVACEFLANYMAKQLDFSNLICSSIAALVGYALATTDGPVSFRYSEKCYLDFLKSVSKDMKEHPDRYQDVQISDFNKVLRKEYNEKEAYK